MKLEDFKHLVDYKIKFDNDLEVIERLTGIRLFESDLITDTYNIFDAAIALAFTEEGQDLVFWWLYEDVPKIIYNKETKIDVEDIEDLWKYMIDDKETYFNV